MSPVFHATTYIRIASAALLAAVIASCTSPLDINTLRRKTGPPAPPLTAKFISMTFEGDDIFGVQDGCELTWYSGVTDSVLIDTSGQITTVRFNLNEVKVKNVLVGKYAELRTFSINFDSLLCSNISKPVAGSMSERNGAEMTVKYGSQTLKLTADNVKNRVYVAATEHRPAHLIQCRLSVIMADPTNTNFPSMKFAARASIIY